MNTRSFMASCLRAVPRRLACLFALVPMLGILAPMHVVDAAVALPPALPRPGGDAGPTKVEYAVWLGDISRIDSAEQTFSANMVFILRWRDPQLAHPGPGAKRYALDDIWHPQVLITNATGEPDGSLPNVVDVSLDGTAVYRQRIVGSFSQALNLRAFPFDRDSFRVQFVVPGQRPEDILFAPSEAAQAGGLEKGVGLGKNLTIQDWKVTGTSSQAQPFTVTPELRFAAFHVEFSAERQAHHFVIKVIIPLILIVMMSWAVFWIEPNDANTRMAVAVTAMLTLIAYRFAIDSDVPKLPYLTRLDAFVLMSSVLVFLSLIEVIVTTKFANRDRIKLAHAIDRRCRWIFPLSFVIGTTVTLAGWANVFGTP